MTPGIWGCEKCVGLTVKDLKAETFVPIEGGCERCKSKLPTGDVKRIHGHLTWWVQVVQYTSAVQGKRWRMCYDDTAIADFDHEPTMNECMEALNRWWNS